jgi:hypothetical protein
MPGSLVHAGAVAICPHAGHVSVIPTNTRVFLSGQPAATASDTFLVAGCPFTIPPAPKPQPCVSVRWLVPALRVRVNGQPAVLQTSTGICQSAEQVPQGPPSIVAVQPRVSGT